MSHLVTYLRLLDADAEGADWREVAKIVLNVDGEGTGARQAGLAKPYGTSQVDD